MNGISRREQTMLLVAGAALLVGVPLLLSSRKDAGGSGVTSVTEARRRQHEVEARLASTRADLEKLQAEVEPQLSPGTSAQLVPQMVQAAQASARAAGVRLTDLRPQPEEEISGLERVPVFITTEARFAQAVRFLYELEQKDRRYHVDQLRLLASDQQSDRIGIELRVVGYVRSEKGEKSGTRS